MIVDIFEQKRDMFVDMFENINIKFIENENCSMRNIFAYSTKFDVCFKNAIFENFASNHEIDEQDFDSIENYISIKFSFF